MRLYDGEIDGIPGTKTQLGLEAAEHAELNSIGAVSAIPVDTQVPRPPNYTQFRNQIRPEQQQDFLAFKNNWDREQEHYAMVAKDADIPAPLIAALHWRESNANFHAYLHQGDKLGRPAINVPKNIPIFPDSRQGWHDAAVHALGMKKKIKEEFSIHRETTDLNALCAFAEAYNGYGYKNKGLPSPYVLSGTTGYQKGKYVSDGKFDPNARDNQLGVLPMLRAAFNS
jgi:lysozyme family protein